MYKYTWYTRSNRHCFRVISLHEVEFCIYLKKLPHVLVPRPEIYAYSFAVFVDFKIFYYNINNIIYIFSELIKLGIFLFLY